MIDDQRTPPIGVGDPAPRFTLPASNGEPVSLDECLARGPVVLLWYVFDFGRVWSNELRAFRENHQKFLALGTTLLGLSVESARAHAAYAQQLELPFLLLSDLNREVVREYGVMYTRERRHREGFYGLSKRAVFVVDGGGTVRYAWITDDSLVEPNMDEVLAAVSQLESAGGW